MPRAKKDEKLSRCKKSSVMLTPDEKEQLRKHANRRSEKAKKKVSESDVIRDALAGAGVIKKTAGAD